MGKLTIATGLVISAVAAWYSIFGLMSIFSGSVIAIAIMGTVLEIGKLITASWLYRNWKTIGFLMKSYLTAAVIILMFITSLGIFGFLSKAHLEQTAPISTVEKSIERLEFQISVQEKNIERNQKVLNQLDKSIDVFFEMEYISKGLEERASQAEERSLLNAEISTATSNISELELEKLNYEQQIQDVELEVGPIRYVAELLYDDAKANLEDTVRYLILTIVFVFDPLAVMLLLAGSHTLLQQKPIKKEIVAQIIDTPTGLDSTDMETENQISSIANVETETEKFTIQTFKDGKKRGTVRIKT
jgi:hypothetical protein